MQLVNVFFGLFLEFVFRGFFKKGSWLLALGLGLLLFQGCTMLQRPPERATPASFGVDMGALYPFQLLE